MKIKIIPLAQQPAYIEASAKLSMFRDELDKAANEGQRIRDAWQATGTERPDAVAEAEHLLSGDGKEQDWHSLVRKNEVLQSSLRRAIEAQSDVVREVANCLSSEAAQSLKSEHKKRTARIVAAVIELSAANRDEEELRDLLAMNGYRVSLPFMSFAPDGSTVDTGSQYGGYATGWHRDAVVYVK